MEYKDYLIEGDNTFGMKSIKAIGKGSVHLPLRGAYTTVNEAKKAIDVHIASRSEPNEQTVSAGRGK